MPSPIDIELLKQQKAQNQGFNWKVDNSLQKRLELIKQMEANQTPSATGGSLAGPGFSFPEVTPEQFGKWATKRVPDEVLNKPVSEEERQALYQKGYDWVEPNLLATGGILKGLGKSYIHKPGATYAASRQEGKTYVGDSFYKLDEVERADLLRHEVGHDLVRDFNKDFKDVFDPLRKGFGKDSYGQNREMFDNPFGFRENPEEIIADTYASLFQKNPYEPGGKYDALRRRVAEIADKKGLEVPDSVRVEYGIKQPKGGQ